MKKRIGFYNFMGMLSAAMVAGGLLLSACTVPTLAANKSSQGAGADPALIDSSKECSLTVYKYDITSAKKAGVQIDNDSLAYGEADEKVQNMLKDYAIEGVEFSYLYCGDIQTYVGGSADAKEIELVCGVPDKLCKILNLDEEDAFSIDGSSKGKYYSTDQIQEAWKDLLVNGVSGQTDTDKNKLAKNTLEDYLKTNKNAKKMPLTDSQGKTSVTGLEQGLYLVVETKVPENVTETVNPWFVTLPFTADSGDAWAYDVTCYPKNQTGDPTLEKLVRDAIEAADGRQTEYEETATASEGETLEYILVSKLPHIQSTATWLTEYTFSDTLSKGLTYGKDAKIAFYTSQEAACTNDLSKSVAIWDVSKDKVKMYTQEYGVTDSSAEFDGTTMTVAMTKKGLEQINQSYSDYWMTVYYTATMHSDESVVLGDTGNPNDVTLLWRRTSNSWFDTLEDQCLIFTYGVDLEKQFSDNQGDVTEAEFILEYSVDGTYLTATVEVQKGDEKIYYVTGRTDDKEKATRFSVAKGGTCQICGLRADEYDLTEEKTDIHYQLLSRAIGFEVIKTKQSGTAKEAATAIVDGQTAALNDSGKLNLQVINYRRVLLPNTGGSSLLGVSLLGAGFIILGCLILRKKKGILQ